MRAFLNLTIAKLSAALQVVTAAMEPMRKPRTIGELSLSPSSRRGASYTVTSGGAPTPFTTEKHALWCLFLEGQALPIGRYARLLAAAISRMRRGSQRVGNGSNPT